MKSQKRLFLHRHKDGGEPLMKRGYDAAFKPSVEYRETLPDMMDTVDAIQGANVPIQQVGVSGFKLPLKFGMENGDVLTLEATVTGTVSLEANLKGINMSRIVRSFYEFKDEVFTLELLEKILATYRRDVGSLDARLKVYFSFPLMQTSLRSGLEGYQFYKAAYEATIDAQGKTRRFIEFDFVYSSACPCSAELAEHARATREAYGIPHSQRSRARLRVEAGDGKRLTVEDMQRHCKNALITETQVMVKREDEQAFAELNGAHIKFVEDAARLLFEQLNGDGRIRDFEAACAHLESLHSHDAVSVICKGVPGGFRADFMDFAGLVC